MDNFREYFIFYKVYQQGGITNAANAIGVTKSTVSRAVVRLEKEYGLKLFFRNGKSLYPTRFGDHLYDYCHKIIHLFSEAKNSSAKFKQECSGVIKIAAPFLFGQTLLSSIISRFSKTFPLASLCVCLSNEIPESEYANYDIVFSLNKSVPDHYIVKDIGSIYTKLFFSKEYTGFNRKSVEKNTFLILSSKHNNPVFKLKIHDQNHETEARILQVRPRIISNDCKIIKEAVINGLGVGILPGHTVAEELAQGVLQEAFENHYVYHDDIYAIYSSFLMMPRIFRAFLDYVSVELSVDLQINRTAFSR